MKDTSFRARRPACRLYRGDAIELLQQLPDRSVHAVITDPPYASTDCAWDKPFDLAAWWEQIHRVTTQGAVICVFAAQPFTTDVIVSGRKHFRYDLVWDKIRPVGFLNANRQPLRVHEQVLVFCRRPGMSLYRPQFVPGRPYRTSGREGSGGRVYRQYRKVAVVNDGRRHPQSILRFDKPSNRVRRHPTEKPVGLLNWLVMSFTRPGQTVLDSFMGSGSTGEAALRRRRHFIGFEKDAAIFSTAAERLAAWTR